MSPPLRPGDFFGNIVHRRQVADLELVDAHHVAGSRVPRHTHDRAYFCMTHEGAYVETYGRRKRRCQPGMVVFHPAGESHVQQHETSVRSFNVEVSARLMARVLDCTGPLDQPVEFHGDEIASAGARLCQELCHGSGDTNSALVIESLSWEILGASARNPERAAAHAPRWLRDAREMLDQSFPDTLDLPRLAREAGVHPVHFAATFRRFIGFSVGEYRRRRRLEYVRQQLRDPNVSLVTLALEAGFADQSHLARQFKRFAGVTPNEYRRSEARKTR